jgi:hypothetical protein
MAGKVAFRNKTKLSFSGDTYEFARDMEDGE